MAGPWWGLRCCCETAGCDCSCDSCSDTAPCCFEVRFANMANGTCSTCSNFNNPAPGLPWYLSQDTPNGCTWSLRIAGGCTLCTGVDAVLTTYLDGSNYKIKVELKDGSTVLHKWEKDYGTTKPDCCALTNESLTHISSGGDCNSASATCTITSSNSATCPGECDGGCLACADNDVPILMQASISGLANDQCNGCTNGNGTFTLEYIGPSSSSCQLSTACLWRYQATTPGICNNKSGCSGITVQFALKQDGANYYGSLEVTVKTCTGSTFCYGARWFKTFSTSVDLDCLDLSVGTAEWSSSSNQANSCNLTSATASIAAL